MDDDTSIEVSDYIADYQVMHCFTEDQNDVTPFGRVLYDLMDAFDS